MVKRKQKHSADETGKASKNKIMKTACSRLKREVFNVPSHDLANLLLGKILFRRLDNGTVLKGRIVETECYPGGEDKASATYGNRLVSK